MLGSYYYSRNDEILGLMLITGILKKPSLKIYWTVNHMFETAIFIVLTTICLILIYDGSGMTLENTVMKSIGPLLRTSVPGIRGQLL